MSATSIERFTSGAFHFDFLESSERSFDASSRAMTWVLGSAVVFGYGALVADVQVSWPGDETRDMQKIHPVGRMLMTGFSGSVRIGFHLAADMQRFFMLPEGQIAQPMTAAWRWHRRGRRIFSRYPEVDRRLDAQILLVGVAAHMNGPFHTARCVRMRAPDFYPEFAKGIRWLSIGRGARSEQARQFADDAYHDQFMLADAQGEVAMPGGVAFTIATSVAMGLAREPIAGVSETLQIGTVFRREHRVDCLIQEFARGAWSGWRRGDCPPLQHHATASRKTGAAVWACPHPAISAPAGRGWS